MTDEKIIALIRNGKAPLGLRGRKLDLSGVSGPLELPAGLHCHTLRLNGTAIRSLPQDLRVDFKLDATDCAELVALPEALQVPVLILRNCSKLQSLPERLSVDYLTLENCEQLAAWPASAQVTIGTVNARNCRRLENLPESLGPITSLDLAGCERLTRVPAGVQVRSWIDIAGTQITSLPEALSKVQLRWRGVAVTAQIAFFPETIEITQILSERNAELRRVMIERVGFERFLQEAKAEVLHRDKDAGGPRELLRVKLQDDEDLVCVSVRCPSTARHYLIRVPPTMTTCHQAVAWTAGFDNPDDYAPLAET